MQAPSSAPFGIPTSQQSPQASGSVPFGSSNDTTGNIHPQPLGGGLFGTSTSNAGSQPPPGSGLFGSAINTALPFGTPTSKADSQPSPISTMFGGSVVNAAKPFGGPTQQAGSQPSRGFQFSNPGTNTANPSDTVSQAPSNPGLFGANSSHRSPAPTFGGFGSTKYIVFGAPPT